MAGRPALPKRLLASVVLLGIGVLFFALAALFYLRGAQWANEFSGVAGFFVALAALFSPLARTMFRWVEQGSAELAIMPFLEDAHQRVLRQQGAVYQFRHVMLQTHLAETNASRRAQPKALAPNAAAPSLPGA
jgi:cytosine/adenosine deaminase-related metal-dependent hydrolase